MKKKKLAFLLGITPNLSFAAGNVALSLNKHMKMQDYDIVIYYTELPQKDIEVFMYIPHVVLKQFNFPENFVETMLAKIPEKSRFRSLNHLMCFSHFEVFPLLAEYENVVWLDADTSIQRDLSDIVKFAPLGITPDTPWTVGDQFSHPIAGYNMDIEGHCTAVLIVNDTLPYNKIHSWLYDKAIEYADVIVNPDQAIFSIMFQEFNIIPNLMPLEEWQCISWRNEASIARIVHFGAEKKVWNNINVCNAFPEWYRTHLEWLQLGGSDFDQTKIDPHNTLGTLDAFDKINSNQSLLQKYHKTKYYLFGFLPIWKIKASSTKIWHYLLCFIPFLKIKIK